MICNEQIGQEVCIENHSGAKFRGTLKGVLQNGNAILLCRGTDIGNGWQNHSGELKVIQVASISLLPTTMTRTV